jgi:hypothetical protein
MTLADDTGAPCATSRPMHVGRRFDDAGRLVAKVTLTQAVL